jgi:hypothetical protein
MNEEEQTQLNELIEREWMQVVKGTYSNTDKRIFADGFRRGYLAGARKELRHALREVREIVQSKGVSSL